MPNALKTHSEAYFWPGACRVALKKPETSWRVWFGMLAVAGVVGVGVSLGDQDGSPM